VEHCDSTVGGCDTTVELLDTQWSTLIKIGNMGTYSGIFYSIVQNCESRVEHFYSNVDHCDTTVEDCDN
jgi:hypothetical protein